MARPRYEVPDYTFPLFQQQVATGRDEIASILQRLLAEMSQQQSERESVRGAETQRLGMAANIAGPLDPAGTLSKLAPSIPSAGIEELVPGVKKRFDLNQQQKMFKQGAQGIGVKQGSNKFDQSVAGGAVEANMKKGIEAVNQQYMELTGESNPVLRVAPRISTKDFDRAIEIAQPPLKQQLTELKYSDYGSTFYSMRASEEELTNLTNAKHQLKRDWLGAQWDVRKTKPFQTKLLRLNTLVNLYGGSTEAFEKAVKRTEAKVKAEAGTGDLGQLMAGSKDPTGSPGHKAYLKRVAARKAEDAEDTAAIKDVVENLRSLIGDQIEVKMQPQFEPQQQGPSVPGFFGDKK